MKDIWEVIVNNVGRVYVGPDGKEAVERFLLYVGASKDNVGRAAGETVVLYKNDEIVREYRLTSS